MNNTVIQEKELEKFLIVNLSLQEKLKELAGYGQTDQERSIVQGELKNVVQRLEECCEYFASIHDDQVSADIEKKKEALLYGIFTSQELVECCYRNITPRIQIDVESFLKRQLDYQIGHYMVTNFKTFSKAIMICLNIKKIYRDFKKSDDKYLTQVELEEDILLSNPEAKRITQHLSYRLGNKVVRYVEKVCWLKLMCILAKEYVVFKKERKSKK